MSAKITILLLTKDHPDSVKQIIEKTKTKGLFYSLVIWDSSGPENSEMVRKLCIGKEWRYIHLNEQMTTDEKTMLALASAEDEYIWPIGDGLILDLPAISFWLEEVIGQSPACIHLVSEDSRNCRKFFAQNHLDRELIYTEIPKLAEDFLWSATFLGSLIIRKDIAHAIAGSNRKAQYLNTGFIATCLLVETLEKYGDQALVSLRHYYYPNPHKQFSMWMMEGKTFVLWSEWFPKAIRMLPETFDGVKDEIIRTVCRRNEYYSLRWMIRWRGMGMLDQQTERLYEAILMEMSAISERKLRWIACSPKWACRLIYFPFEFRNIIKRKLSIKK